MLVIAAPAFGGALRAGARCKIGADGAARARAGAGRSALPESVDRRRRSRWSSLREMAIGLALGARRCASLIAGAEFAGHSRGFQIGFAYARLDRSAERRAQQRAERALRATSRCWSFLAINGHHELLRALAASYAALPIGVGGVERRPGAAASRACSAWSSSSACAGGAGRRSCCSSSSSRSA